MGVLGKPAMQAILFAVFSLLSGTCMDVGLEHTGFAFGGCAFIAVAALCLSYLNGGCTAKTSF